MSNTLLLRHRNSHSTTSGPLLLLQRPSRICIPAPNVMEWKLENLKYFTRKLHTCFRFLEFRASEIRVRARVHMCGPAELGSLFLQT